MLRIENLYKKFGKLTAIDNLNFEIESKEIFGFIGQNGAGKTTTMKIIVGLLKLSEGNIYIDGEKIRKDSKIIKNKVGYMPDFFGVYDNLKVIEYMEFYASIYNINGKEAKKLSYELLELVNLKEKAECYVDTLSRGMKQKLCLARTMVNNPKLLILDEPCSGMDPTTRVEMKNIMKNLNSEGKTILISSHILGELSELCTTVGIIQKGKMLAKGTVEEIMMNFNASIPLNIKIIKNQRLAVEILKRHTLVENIVIKEELISISFLGNESEEGALLRELVEAGIIITSYYREQSNLETLFMQLTAKKEEK